MSRVNFACGSQNVDLQELQRQRGALKPLPEENSADVSLRYIDPKGVLYELEFPIVECGAYRTSRIACRFGAGI